MNIDQILAQAVQAIKSSMPEALYAGQLIKQTRVFNPSTNINDISDTLITDVEIVFEALTTKDVSGSVIKMTDVKMHIIANSVKEIDFYDLIRVKGIDHKISMKLETVVGATMALFTIVASVG